MVEEERVVHGDGELQREDDDAGDVGHLLADVVTHAEVHDDRRADGCHERQRHHDRGHRQEQDDGHEDECDHRESHRVLVHDLFELELLVTGDERLVPLEGVADIADRLLDVRVVRAAIEGDLQERPSAGVVVLDDDLVAELHRLTHGREVGDPVDRLHTLDLLDPALERIDGGVGLVIHEDLDHRAERELVIDDGQALHRVEVRGEIRHQVVVDAAVHDAPQADDDEERGDGHDRSAPPHDGGSQPQEHVETPLKNNCVMNSARTSTGSPESIPRGVSSTRAVIRVLTSAKSAVAAR